MDAMVKAGTRRSKSPIQRMVRCLFRSESGATAIEYGFLAALIALGLIGMFVSIGESVTTFFTDVNAGFEN